MQRPILSKVPNPLFPSIRDINITLYTLSYTRAGPSMIGTNLRGSSLEGQRSIADFFHILDNHITVINADDYKLRQLDDECRPLVGPPIE
ncbi:hypothetical protein PILCRDRAFT_16096 [Piloderma croceum F 1598]|uniref:Uncharacterized protein n=1 Tax=Piloderma croceum (strain F 1598) TaxID=765440 RepID=A0A0C3EWV3_PILCF|nr:hypothetical protein PILCRDRAFT_16096 [Piloderma croceum F 1598]